MNKLLTFDDYLKLDIDYKNVINSTLDLRPSSVLCINLKNQKKLEQLIKSALKKGVDKIITSDKVTISDNKVIKFKDYEQVFEHILHKINPTYKEKTYFGITGTNGKTTTGHLLDSLIGETSVFVGTIDEDYLFSFTNEEHLTTPKLFNLVKMLSKIDESIQNVVLEVSSHALFQNRLDSLKFKMSGFTNLSQDHLDYHNTMEDYFQAKTKLFDKNISENFVFIDSEYGKKLNNMYENRGISIGSADISPVRLISFQDNLIDFMIDDHRIISEINISGPEIVNNFLLAFSMAYYSKVKDIDELKKNIPLLRNPKGRYEIIKYKKGDIIVDYSHTPQAIEKVIDYTKSKYKKKIIVIFGAGGNRDKSKRINMGKASQKADKIIITNDNPRDEDASKIARQLLDGIKLNKDVEVELDRKTAITKGIDLLDENSVLLVLGKGHEDYQEIDGRHLNFNDKKVILEIIGKK